MPYGVLSIMLYVGVIYTPAGRRAGLRHEVTCHRVVGGVLEMCMNLYPT